MRWLRRVVGPTAEEEIREEFDFHLAMRARELETRGMDPDAARAAAEREFGDPSRAARECRRAARRRDRRAKLTDWARDLRQDASYGARHLASHPLFAAVALLTLALGIGATTSIFTVVSGVLLRPLPYPQPERIVVPRHVDLETGTLGSVTYPDFLDWQQAGVFEHVSLMQRFPLDMMAAEGGVPERVSAAVVTADHFDVLGIRPVAGRLPPAESYEYGQRRGMILSYEYWRRAYGGSSDLSVPILAQGNPVEVWGVLPPGASWGIDVYLPMQMSPAAVENATRRDNFIFEALARLAEGSTLGSTRAALRTLAARAAREHSQIRNDVSMTAVPLTDHMVGGETSRALWVLFGAVGLVLLIACVNVANLLLGRAATRTGELRVRAALGAGRWRLTRQLVAESLVLGGAGGALGLVVAWGGQRALVALAPPGVPRLDEVRLDLSVLAFAAGVAVLSALLFGVAPALRSAWSNTGDGMRGAGRTTAGRRSVRNRGVLVAAELALSVVLLVGAGLMARSFARLTDVQPGFRTDRVLTFTLSLSGQRYAADGALASAYERLVERLRAVPGVEDAGLAGSLPLGGGGFYLGRAFLPEGGAEPPAGEEVSARWVPVSPGYFETLDIPLLRGRAFHARDDGGAVPVAIITRSFAEAMFDGMDAAVGRRVRSWRDENVYREVVGVVEDAHLDGAAGPSLRAFYVPYAQSPWSSIGAVVATEGAPRALDRPVREAVADIDPLVAVADLSTMEELLAADLARARFVAVLMAGFALLALVLAAVGTFGVLNHAVSQRTREIGVRMALGASRGPLLRMVLAHAIVLAVVGVAAGLLGSIASGRLLESLLYETSPADPVTLAAAAAVLAAVALGAALLPALRATRVDPVTSIRAE